MYFAKLTVIGQGRKWAMSRYLFHAQEGGIMLRLPGLTDCRIEKNEDHHAKLHLHFFSLDYPGDAVRELILKHTELRFSFYFENAEGYGTIYSRHGKLTKETWRKWE